MMYLGTNELIYFIFILIIGFVLRVSLIVRYGWVGKDTFYHLLISRVIREKKELPKQVDRFVLPEEYDYPPLTHVLLSKISEKNHKKIQLFFPFTDILTVIVLFFFCSATIGISEALLAIAFYSVTPFAIDLSLSLGPRVIANFFLIITLLSTYSFLESNNVMLLITAVFSAALVMLTQRLAVQSMIAILVGVAIVFINAVPILIIICAILVAIVLSKGFYIKVIRGHYDFIRVLGNRLFDSQHSGEQASPFLQITPILFNLPIIGILFVLPFFSFTWSPPMLFSLVWVISLLVLSTIWVFGEGYRHMANSVAPMAIICSVWSMNIGIAMEITIVSGLLGLSIFKLIRLAKRKDLGMIFNSELLEAFEYVKKMADKDDIVITIPTDLSYHAAYFTGCITAHSSGGFAKGLLYNYNINRMVKEGRIMEIVNKLNVNWVITIDNTHVLSSFQSNYEWNGVHLYYYKK